MLPPAADPAHRFPLVALRVDDEASASPASPSPAIWVGDAGLCSACGELTVRDVCRRCESTRVRERVAERARLRPSWVFTGPEDAEPEANDAVLPVPKGASESAKHVAGVAAHEASIRLALHETLDFALCKVALGRDWVTRTLADGSVKLDRKTVANALEELGELGVLKRVGQLDGWFDMQAEGGPMTKKGAYVYELNVRCRQLGSRGIAAIRRVASQSNRAFGASSPLSATVRGTVLGQRMRGCLSAAIRLAQVGQRNNIGHWLACRCTDAGLTEGEAMKVLMAYRDNVPQGSPYTTREVQRTVQSRYTHHAP